MYVHFIIAARSYPKGRNSATYELWISQPALYVLCKSQYYLIARKMAANLSGEQACLFPILNAHSNEQHNMRRKEIDLLPRAALVEFCENNSVQLLSLFKMAWALVLHVYTGADSPVFGFQFPTESGDGQNWTCRMEPFSGESLLNILKAASLPDAAVETQSVETFNTAVVHKHAETGSNVGNLAMLTFSANHSTGPIVS